MAGTGADPTVGAKPAPAPLVLVQAFVNTRHGLTGPDLLADPESARAWLVRAGLLGTAGRVGEDDLLLVRGVREGLRALLVDNAGGGPPAASALSALRTLAGSSWFRPVLERGQRVELQLEGGADDLALGRLLVIVRDSQCDGTWRRLKACHEVNCRRAFYDRSHAVRGTWCDMATCGNRSKNRAFRARHAAQPPPA